MTGPYPLRDIYRIVLGLVIAWIFVGYIRYALVAPPSFDGAMNLNTALSFVQRHGYGFIYNEFFPFPAQTDAPLTLPAGVLMWLGGVTPLTTQAVNLAYLAGMIAVCFMLLRRMTNSFDAALCGCAILLMTPGLFPYSIGGFGEIPLLFWLLLSVATLAPCLDDVSPKRTRLALGGAALAFCFLTKTVALFAVAPTIVVFSLLFALRTIRRSALLLWFAAGLILPVLGWEAFRLAELGGFSAYQEWWALQVQQALTQSGANEALGASRGPLAKAAEHFHILAELAQTPAALLELFLIFPWGVALAVIVAHWRQRQRGAVFRTACIAAVCFLYFFWWLFIERTEMAWLRRIVDGLLLQQLLLVLATTVLIRAAWRQRSGVALALVLACLAASCVLAETSLVAAGETVTRPPAASAKDLDELALANKIRQIPADATLFGFGWWKAPVLALFSGRTVMNYNHWSPASIDALPQKYLILDYFAKSVAARDAQDILQAGSAYPIADGPGGAIYRLDKVLPYAPFTLGDENPAKLSPGLTAETAGSGVTRGFYPSEGKDLWVKPNAALLLRRSSETRLFIHIYVPTQLVADQPGASLRLRVASAHCMDSSVPIVAGDVKLVLPLDCPAQQAPTAMRISFDLNGHVPSKRQIDADPRRLGYLAKDIHLEAD